MTDYNPIPDNILEPDDPIPADLGIRWRDNPIAITEGSPGAPYEYASWRPYNSLVWGDANTGVLFDRGADPAATLITSPAFVAGNDYRFVLRGLSPNANVSLALTLAAYNGSWGSTPYNISNAAINLSGTFFFGWVDFLNPMATGNFRSRRLIEYATINHGGSSGNIESSAVDKGLVASHRGTDGTGISQARIGISVGSINAGRVTLYQRPTQGGQL